MLKMKNRFFAEEGEFVDNSGAAEPSTPSTPAAETAANVWEDMSSDAGEDFEAEGDIGFEQPKPDTSTEIVPEPKPAELKVDTPPTAEASTTEPAATETEPEKPAAEVSAPFDWNKWETDSIAALEENYQLSEEEIATLVTEPEKVLPRMAASVHVAVIKNVLAQLPSMLPALIRQMTQSDQAETKQRDTFFSVNKDLSDARFMPAIQAFGQAFRQQNPTADAATAVIQVGNMVRLSMGMPLHTKDAQTAPETPAERTRPFVSAGTGGAAQALATSNNPFTQMAEELMLDN